MRQTSTYYHGTVAAYLEGIADEGLLPERGYVWVAGGEEAALRWARFKALTLFEEFGQRSRPVVLRFEVADDVVVEPDVTLDGEPVPDAFRAPGLCVLPEEIEVRRGSGWHPLKRRKGRRT